MARPIARIAADFCAARSAGRPVGRRTLQDVRVMSLLPSATEIVFALGCGDDLVGVTFECDYPPAARQRRVVSTSTLPAGLTPAEIDSLVSARVAAGEDLYHLDEGALAELDVELVLTQDLCAVCAVDLDRVDDALEYLGCRADIVTLDPHSLDDVLESILAVGDALGRRHRADAVVDTLRGRLDSLATKLAGVHTPPVLTLEWTDPPFSAGHWVPDLVIAGGGSPVLHHRGHESQRVDWEAVSACAADVVVIAPCGYHLDAAATLAEELAATQRLPPTAAVWAVDADAHFVRPGPRLIDGAETIAHILHPQRVGPPDRRNAARITPAH
jgi:iron complex transport system substrate-binding protein